MPDTEDNKAAVTRFLEVFSEGNVEKILDSLSDDATWWVSGQLAGMSGSYDKAGFGQLIGGVADVYKAPLRITPLAMVAEDNVVAVETSSRAELKDGGVYEPDGHFLFKLAPDGRMAVVHEYIDTKHAHDTFFAS